MCDPLKTKVMENKHVPFLSKSEVVQVHKVLCYK